MLPVSRICYKGIYTTYYPNTAQEAFVWSEKWHSLCFFCRLHSKSSQARDGLLYTQPCARGWTLPKAQRRTTRFLSNYCSFPLCKSPCFDLFHRAEFGGEWILRWFYLLYFFLLHFLFLSFTECMISRVPNGPTSQVLKRRLTGQSQRKDGTQLDWNI